MTRWLAVLTAYWLSSAAAQLSLGVTGIGGAFTREAVSVKDPIDKTAVYIGFSQCQNVKRILGVDYGQPRTEPDFSQLELAFITTEVKIRYNLTTLSSVTNTGWFKPNQGLIIYLHGFTDDPSKEGFQSVNNAFLSQGIGNVVALDASSLIRWFYLRSSTMVRYIGEQLGYAIVRMMKAGLSPGSVYLVGHSLGSHIAGFAGKTVLALTGQRVGRITGLDPAGPCFADVAATLRLHMNDAMYVDVIHTDAGVYGLNEPIGHADYWPNRGSEQPECLLQTCSHSFAWLLYTESVINPRGFPAVSCSSWKDFESGACNYSDYSFMGYGSKFGTVGQYFLQTAGKSPYALGVGGVTRTGRDGIVRTIRDFIGLWK